MPRFPQSTHCKNWTFSLEAFQEKIRSRQEAFINSISQWVQGTNLLNFLLTPQEDEELMLLLTRNILIAAPALNLPDKAISTAISYFRRFFLKYTPYEFDPFVMMFTALYVACKTEELNITSLEYFCSFYKQSDAKLILRHEIILVSGINFQLYVFSPFKCVDYAVITLSQNYDMTGVGEQAKEFVKNSVLSDSLFLETPSYLALAGVYEACEKFMNRDEMIGELVGGEDLPAAFAKIQAIIQMTKEALQKIQEAEGKLGALLKKARGVRHQLKKIQSRGDPNK